MDRNSAPFLLDKCCCVYFAMSWLTKWLTRRHAERPSSDRSAVEKGSRTSAGRFQTRIWESQVRQPQALSRPAGGSERIGGSRFGVSDVAGGCLLAMGSTAISCGLLVINGALVMAVLATLSAAGVPWVRNDQVSQFLLFSIPVALLIVQWMMIDYVRHIVRKNRMS